MSVPALAMRCDDRRLCCPPQDFDKDRALLFFKVRSNLIQCNPKSVTLFQSPDRFWDPGW